MRRYRSTWLVLWGAVAVLGVGLGFLVWSVPTVVVSFTIAAAAAAMVNVALNRREGLTPRPRRDLVRTCVTKSGWAAAGVVTVAVVGTIAPVLMWPLLLMAVVTSPWAVGFCLGRAAGGRERPEEGTGAETAGDKPFPTSMLTSWVQDLSDRELCMAWRAGFDALQSGPSAAGRAQIVALRQVYLDEIERRNPSALTAWLASEPRAAGSPDRYLLFPRPPGNEDQKKAS